MADKAEAQFAGIDDLFSADLNDIADLASFETPPPGTYLLRVSTDVKEINDKPAIEASFEIVETVDLKFPEGHDKYIAKKPDGTKFSTAFILGNAFSEGKLKQFLAPFATHFNVTGPGAVGRLVRDTIKDVMIAATVKTRADKDDPEKIYASVTNIIVS